MAKKSSNSGLKSPFLKRVSLLNDIDHENFNKYPLSIPAFKSGIDLEFENPVTIIVGDNGSGKSTFLEAIAAQCGFSLSGGTKNLSHRSSESESLSQYLRLGWLPKVTQGFFFRAETFFQLVDAIDKLAEEPGGHDAYLPYGGTSMRQRSHGQSFMTVFENRFGSRGTYIIDEPEAALSPERQLEFLQMLRRLDLRGDAQVIMATHSPLLMAYPNATLIEIYQNGFRKIEFHETKHFKIIRDFSLNPDNFIAGVLMDVDAEFDLFN